MKTILCYGDSLTWGSDPATGGRHPPECRWPNVLQAGLGGDYCVITDGLRGRTTGYDEHLADCDRNGARLLATALYAHAPLDLVILLLGSNDMKPHIAGTAIAARQGIKRLAAIARNHNPGPDLARPKVLIVSPPPLCETPDGFFAALFAGGIEPSRALASHYAEEAKAEGAEFFDGGSAAETSPLDGVHLDAGNTVKLGRALVGEVRRILG
ncbi:MAG: SGNH/GDSL hydrolase family protein [Nitratireductor sp.]|nr:SGNH/GDSL hydrolase family protein [Nitratireductor sp.]